MSKEDTNIQQTFVLVKTYWRRLQDVFSVTFFCLPRRLEDIIARRLANTSWRRLEDVLGRRIANTSWRRLQEVLEDENCYAEDVLENNKCLLGNMVSFPFNMHDKFLQGLAKYAVIARITNIWSSWGILFCKRRF